MIDETEKKIRLAEEADKLLKNKLLLNAFTQIRNDCYRDIELSSGEDIEKREDAYFLLKSITKLESKFTSIIKHGRDAKAKLDNTSNIKRMIRE